MDQDPQEETEGVDTAGIDRLHKFQQDMNKIIEERDANSLVRPLGSDYLLTIWLFNENVFFFIRLIFEATLESEINVAPWVYIAPGKFGKKNKLSPIYTLFLYY